MCPYDVPSSIANSLHTTRDKISILQPIALRRLRTEVDEQITPALALPHWKGHDAAEVVFLRTAFLLAKVPDEPCANVIDIGDHIEEEGLDIVEKGLVVQKHLGQETEVLAVDLVLAAVDLEDGDRTIAVNLVARRMTHLALELHIHSSVN